MPLSLVNGLMIDIYVSIINGSTVDFSDITNNEFKVIDALKQVRPKCLFAAPYIWEKIWDEITGIKARCSYYTDIFTKRFDLGLASIERNVA